MTDVIISWIKTILQLRTFFSKTYNTFYLKYGMAWIADIEIGLAPKSMQEKESNKHEFEERIDKPVPRVTVWHHLAEPHDAKQ